MSKGTNLSLVRMTQFIVTNSVIYTELLSGHCRQWFVAAAEMDKNTQEIIVYPHYSIFTHLATSTLPIFQNPTDAAQKYYKMNKVMRHNNDLGNSVGLEVKLVAVT